MVLIICTINESNLTNRYWDMVPDRQKVRTDARRTPKLCPSNFVGGLLGREIDYMITYNKPEFSRGNLVLL